MSVCLHFDPIRRESGCELGRGRVAPRDCTACAAYVRDSGMSEPDPVKAEARRAAWYGDSITESGNETGQ